MTTSTKPSITNVAGTLAGVVEALLVVSSDLESKHAVVVHERDDARKTVSNLQAYRSKLEAELRDVREAARQASSMPVDGKLSEELTQARDVIESLRFQMDSMSTPAEVQDIINSRDAALSAQKDLERELDEAYEQLKAYGSRVAERDEARAALKRAQTAQSSAEEAEKAALERLAKTEKQLNGTVGALQEAQSALKTAERRVHELEGELEQLREANLTLTEETKSTPAAPASPVDATALRARLSAATKWLDKDDPEMLAGALAGAFKELDRLEGK